MTDPVRSEFKVAAAEINLWLHRRLGELLEAAEKHKGGRPSKTHDTMSSVSTLAELGVTGKQSERWQKLAGLEEPAFQGYLDRARKTQRPATHAGAESAERIPLSGFYSPASSTGVQVGSPEAAPQLCPGQSGTT
jgi:hypothetical protein